MTQAGSPPLRWARQIRFRQDPFLDHSRLHWYRDQTATYWLTARALAPAFFALHSRLTVDGLDNLPSSGPLILAANHRDNLDPYLLLHLVPRLVHVAARPDGFGTGGLCGIWRRLGAFPADGWGLRHALSLLADGGVVAVFPQGRISDDLRHVSGAVGLLAAHSGAPVVPIAISGSEHLHFGMSIARPAQVSVRFGQPTVYERGRGAARSLAVANQILAQIGALMSPEASRSPR